MHTKMALSHPEQFLLKNKPMSGKCVYSNVKGCPLYHDLSACRVLFGEDGDPCLSYFGLEKNCRDGRSHNSNLAYTPPEYLKNGRVPFESVTYRFGTVLLDLLSGKHIFPSQALVMIRSKNLTLLMDTHLEGKFSTEQATEVVDLASKCLQYEPRERPSTKDLVVTLAPLQTKPDVPSHVMLQISKPVEAPSTPQRPLSPIGEACSRMDLTAIHQILVMTQNKYGNGTNEVRVVYKQMSCHISTLDLCECGLVQLSFQEWTQQMSDMIEARKHGDYAFRDKEFKTAIEYYSQFINVGTMVSATVYARCSLCYTFSDQPDAALLDAIQTLCVYQDCPTFFYMQSVALPKLNVQKDSIDTLNEGAEMEEKKQRNARAS